MPNEEILNLKNISKSFPGVVALKNIYFDLKKGEVHCLCGENGAGKSTLIKILSGAIQPDEGGEIIFEGKSVKLNPLLAMNLGIQTIYQEHEVFTHLNVTENIFTGLEISKRGFLKKDEMRKKVAETLEYLKSNVKPDAIMGDLNVSEQKIVEIAKSLIFKKKVIILDEPTASFSVSEIDNLLQIIMAVKESGIGIIYISHHLEEVFRIADRVTILRDGYKISTYYRDELTEQKLIKDMVGRDASAFYKRENVPIGEIIFEVKNITGNGVKNISFNLRRGEILGIAGMAGSGRSELMDVLFGAKHLDFGEILINGKVIKINSPIDAIKNKICYITEDRQDSGLFLKQTIAQNVIIANLVNFRKFIMRPSEDNKIGKNFIKLLNIRANSPSVRVINLSGGNQQKVVLAKWFNTNGDIFIFDEPTRGLDIGAKQEIYQIMVDLLKKGKAIIMVSSELPEIIAMSDRVIVMKDGEAVASLEKDKISEENILIHSIGGSKIWQN
jgi:ribose transport system ATP-binding protein